MDRKKWTIDEIRAHGATIGFETAAEVLGIGKSLAYELARAGQFPIRRIQLGRRVVVSVPELLKFLGAD
ncbi:MAG TPA: hypothetical protein DGG94_07415 [Micromonosporaceae bacterium]|nr:hypothetical protein [Micromonosporaceae bacterium]HCU49614.1 hypothetical protein [Micromonosporaceae bacterium]